MSFLILFAPEVTTKSLEAVVPMRRLGAALLRTSRGFSTRAAVKAGEMVRTSGGHRSPLEDVRCQDMASDGSGMFRASSNHRQNRSVAPDTNLLVRLGCAACAVAISGPDGVGEGFLGAQIKEIWIVRDHSRGCGTTYRVRRLLSRSGPAHAGD